ncbi:hypothetical protein CDD82_5376 [Ophiocordyceps australis]|uniref:Uncharacterized protein n=1 Tax=Ophiocordyceps australis TaxID=1399860 RepID=A0A2C5Z2K9_9HYPO|nr:hypothetical protein CDD82_5376 [Ophiocordyceps australis]
MRFTIIMAALLPGLLAAPTEQSSDAAFASAVQSILDPAAGPCAANDQECRSGSQAAPFIAAALQKYKLTCAGQAASVISLMAFESVNFRYKHNVSPGRPGQGTANMQMASYNLEYARSLSEVRDKIPAGVTSVEGQSPQTLNQVLALVQPDEFNFGSGPWFLRNKCDEGVVQGLANGNVDEGFRKHMACVGVSVDEARLAYFERAKKALKVGGGNTGCAPVFEGAMVAAPGGETTVGEGEEPESC